MATWRKGTENGTVSPLTCEVIHRLGTTLPVFRVRSGRTLSRFAGGLQPRRGVTFRTRSRVVGVLAIVAAVLAVASALAVVSAALTSASEHMRDEHTFGIVP